MPRILGVDIPADKRIDIALRYIYGIGPVNALEILERANIDPSLRAKALNESQLSLIVNAIQEGKYVTEGDLRRELGMNLKRLQAIKPWPAHQDERPHPQGPPQDGGRQEGRQGQVKSKEVFPGSWPGSLGHFEGFSERQAWRRRRSARSGAM